MQTGGEGGQPNVDVRTDKKLFSFFLFFIIQKHFLSNINSIFEHSVLDKNRLDCKVYPFPQQTPFAYITSLPQKQKLLSSLSFCIYLMSCKLERCNSTELVPGLLCINLLKLKAQRQISDFFDIQCVSLEEVTVQNFKLLLPIDIDLKSFLNIATNWDNAINKLSLNIIVWYFIMSF